ncbi:hypothetical protein WUBG_12816 [Wuchereria bancrofti]|uniref:Uncharacterized protein n=1 Tax=Wuchereria bancrofti TaxID=6293 RepID=J9ELQ6_WUCBA|nr:hypothetical protein WUBG_12816 [Wuchereria bancrofti]
MTPTSIGSLWMQTKAIPSKKVSRFHRYYPDFQEVTMNTSDSCHKEKETSRLRLDRGYLQQQDQVNNAPAPSLSTTEIKTPRGWQRTFLHVSCKTSRLDRFAPQFVEAVSAQVWITEPLQRTAPLRQTLPPKPSKYNIWQWISSHSSQKTSRFKRFWRPEMNDMKLTSQPSQCILRQEKSANKFSLTESRISRGMIWKRTVSKSLPKVPRLDRFPIPENSISKISQGSFRSQQFGEVSLDFLSTKTPLSNALSSSATLPIRQQRGSYYEQAEPIHLSKVSNKSSLSSLHVTQSGSSKASLTESLSSETLSKKRSNFIIKPVHRVCRSECYLKNTASNSLTTETQLSEALVFVDMVPCSRSLWKQSKSVLQRTSRFERFQERILSTSFEKSAVCNALPSSVSMTKQLKISKLLQRISRSQKNDFSVLRTAQAKSSFVSVLSDTLSSEEPLSKRSKSISSQKSSGQSSGHLASFPCICSRSTVQKSSRIKRFQNSISLDLCTALTRSSSTSLFSNISMTPTSIGSLWMQTKAIPSKKVSRFHRYYPDFQEVTMNTSDSCHKEVVKMLDRSCRSNPTIFIGTITDLQLMQKYARNGQHCTDHSF